MRVLHQEKTVAALSKRIIIVHEGEKLTAYETAGYQTCLTAKASIVLYVARILVNLSRHN